MPGNNGCVAADGAGQVSGNTSPSDNEYRTKALPASGNKLNLSASPIKFQKTMNARPIRHPPRKGMTLKLPGMLVILAGLPISGLVSIFPHPVKAEEETTIVLNTTGNAPLNTPDQQGFVDLVATEAFQRIGVRVKTVKLPAERGLINANQGIHDGEMLRVGGLDKIYQNLVMVPEKIMDGYFVAFSKKDIDLSSGWSALEPYSVVFINGWKILEKNVPAKTSVIKVRSATLLFPMLELGRADIVLYEQWGGLYLLAGYQPTTIRELKPPLASRPLYMYLNKAHQDMVPEVSNALQQMKADGSYQKIVDRILTPLKPSQ
jgi:polar amino acid transport system substrate-binding protein